MKPKAILKKIKQYSKRKKMLIEQTEKIIHKRHLIKEEKIKKIQASSIRIVTVSTTDKFSQASLKDNSRARNLQEQKIIKQHQIYEEQRNGKMNRGNGDILFLSKEEFNSELGDPTKDDFDIIHQ